MISGRQIRAARALLDWDAGHLAEKVGLSRTSIQNIESGVSKRPKVETIQAIVAAFDEAGVEFLEGDGVRRRVEGITVLQGGADFLKFYDKIYETMKAYGGEVCIGGSDSSLYSKYRPHPEDHRKRMAELVKERNDIRVKILCKEGDYNFVASDYAEYRWQKKEHFSPTTFYTFGDYLALISFFHSPSPHIILIKSGIYAVAYKHAFNVAWEAAIIPPPKEAYNAG